MLSRFVFPGIFVFFLASCAGRKALIVPQPLFRQAAAQYYYLSAQRPAAKFPKTWHPGDGLYEWSGPEWWCSGFYPGSLLLLFEQTGDTALLSEAKRMLRLLEGQQHNRSTHDLGFMLFCSFGNALRIQPDTGYRRVLLNGARSLSTRFSPVTGTIRSWDSKKEDEFLVIIDNMMNLELLFWATRETGDSSFYRIAVTHANTTLKNHFRPDHSSYHVVDYDSRTGAVRAKRTAQGHSDASSWARGQAWGLYGFTVMYRETRDRTYLDQAIAIADYILANLPTDGIPYWDYSAPGIPDALRDASAAAITASALLELGGYSKGKTYRDMAGRILQTLQSNTYLAAHGSNGGFLLQHGVGHMPNNTEVDVPLTYADYYFLEALVRYQDINKKTR